MEEKTERLIPFLYEKMALFQMEDRHPEINFIFNQYMQLFELEIIPIWGNPDFSQKKKAISVPEKLYPVYHRQANEQKSRKTSSEEQTTIGEMVTNRFV